MAAYAHTHSSFMRKAIPIGDGIGVFVGQVNLTNYNAVNVAVTAISGKFKSVKRVVTMSETSNGYRVSWTGTSFKAWRSLTAAADTEAPDDTNIGTFDYIAFGLV